MYENNKYNNKVNKNDEHDSSNSSYEKLESFIGDEINNMVIIQAHHQRKSPIGEWKNYKKTLSPIKKHKGNIGAIFRAEDKHKYCVIDLDGYKEHEKENNFYLSAEENKAFKKHLLSIFKNYPEIYDYSIVQKTLSDGFHLIFKHEEKDRLSNEFMNNFKIPETVRKNFEIPFEHLGKGSESGAIELFLNNTQKFIILAPSRYKDKKTGKYKEYEITHVGSQFGEPVINVTSEIKQAMEKAGYKYDPAPAKENKKKTKKNTKNDLSSEKNNKDNHNVLENSETKNSFLNDEKLLNLFVEEFKTHEGNHNSIIGVYTAILKSIDLSDNEAESYMKKVLTGADDNTNEHINQVKSYISTNNGTKPNFKKYLNNNKLNKLLDKYFKSIAIKKAKEREKEQTEIMYKNLSNFYGFKQEDKDKLLPHIRKIMSLSQEYFYPPDPKNKLPKHTVFSNISQSLTYLFNIKKNTTNLIKYYYLDYKKLIYKELDEHKLQIILKKITKENYNISDCKKIITTIVDISEINNKYINCKNGLLNKRTGALESKEILVNELVIDNLMFTSGDGKSELLEYIDNVQIDNEDPTLLEKTLKEICIPKSEPENTKIYIDRLQRFGSNILNRKTKSIAYYYTNHQNSGKSGLRSIHSRLMNCAVINPEIFEDNFNYNQIGNTKAILIDETQKGDLEKNISKIKLMSSPDTRQDNRIMYSDKTTKTKFGNLEIYTNYLINLTKNETALFFRIDVIQLPNHFVETKEQMKKIQNSYLVNEKLFDNGGQIETDYKGWCWLASASIQEYLKMEKTGKKFECRQSTEETMQILLKADPLTEFLVKHISYVDDGSIITTNKEILTEFKYFCETKGYSITDNDNSLAKKIGFKLKEEYGEYVKVEGGKHNGAKYHIKIKKIEEIEEEFRQVYIMNENLTDKQVDWLKTLQGHRKRIYDDIKTGEANTIFKLNKKYRNMDNSETIKDLENLGLVLNTLNTTLT